MGNLKKIRSIRRGENKHFSLEMNKRKRQISRFRRVYVTFVEKRKGLMEVIKSNLMTF